MFLTFRFSHKIHLPFSADSASNRSYCWDISWKVKSYTAGAPGRRQEKEESQRGRGYNLFLHLLFEGKDSPCNLQSPVVILPVHTWRFSRFKRRNETDPLYPCLLCHKRETSCAIQGSNTVCSPLVNCHCQQHVRMCNKGSCALAGVGPARSANTTADEVKQQSEEALGGMLLEVTGLKMPGPSAPWCPGYLSLLTTGADKRNASIQTPLKSPSSI